MTLIKMLPVFERLFTQMLLAGTGVLWLLSMFGAFVQIYFALDPADVMRADMALQTGPMWLLSVAHLAGLCLTWRARVSRWRRFAPNLFFVVSVLAAGAMCYMRPPLTPLALVSVGLVTLSVAPHVTRLSTIVMSVLNVLMLIGATMYTEPILNASELTLADKAVHLVGVLLSRLLIFVMISPVYRAIYQVLRESSDANAALRMTERLLREEVAERQKTSMELKRQNSYLSALNETSAGLIQRMDKKAVVEAIVKRACALLDVEHAFVGILQPDKHTVENAVSIGLFSDEQTGSTMNVRRRDGMSGRVLQTGKSIIVDDHRDWHGAVALSNDPVRAIAVVPLIMGDATIGVLGLAHVEPGRTFHAEQIEIIERFAGLAAVALDNASLYEASRKHAAELEARVFGRTRELSAMLNIANVLSSTFDLDALLGRFFAELSQVIPATSGAVFIMQSDEQMRIAYYHGELNFQHVPPWPVRAHLAEVFYGRKPVIIADVHDARDQRAAKFRELTLEHLRRPVSREIVSWLGVPMIIHDKVVGLVTLDHETQGAFTAEQADLAVAMSQQAALAVENARLHTQTVQAAAAAERSRLARDLHDSVSQAVFGISLGARSMERLAIDDPSRALEPLPYVLSLADAALTEMRALIFELRPESLEQEGLLSALQKQMAATSARHSITVIDCLCPAEPDVHLKLKEALYRITLEAIHNAVKYARCSAVKVELRDEQMQLILDISDDGIGFEPDLVPQGHFGLKSMRERVTQLDGQISIESTAGHGTRISVRMPKTKVTERFSFDIAPAV